MADTKRRDHKSFGDAVPRDGGPLQPPNFAIGEPISAGTSTQANKQRCLGQAEPDMGTKTSQSSTTSTFERGGKSSENV